MKLLAGLLLLVAPTLVAAPTTPAPAEKPVEFDTMNEAATRALQLSARISEAYEYGGVIAQLPDGKFAVALPDTMYGGDHTSIDEDPDDYPEGKIVATYHTHPCLSVTHIPNKFSTQDLKSARTTNHVAYMGDLCTGDVHRWRPGVDGYDKEPTGDLLALLFSGVSATATGEIVGHFAVTKPPLENVSPGKL